MALDPRLSRCLNSVTRQRSGDARDAALRTTARWSGARQLHAHGSPIPTALAGDLDGRRIAEDIVRARAISPAWQTCGAVRISRGTDAPKPLPRPLALIPAAASRSSASRPRGSADAFSGRWAHSNTRSRRGLTERWAALPLWMQASRNVVIGERARRVLPFRVRPMTTSRPRVVLLLAGDHGAAPLRPR